MITEDITLNTTSHSGNEFGDLSIIKNISLLFIDITNFSIGALNTNEQVILECQRQASLEMKCEIDDLINEVESELKKAKELLKKKHPIKSRLRVLGTCLRSPVSFLFGTILIVKQKLWPKK